MQFCDGRNCRIVDMPATGPETSWMPLPGEPYLFARYVGGIQLGIWNSNEKWYRTYDATSQKWGEKSLATATGNVIRDAAPPVTETRPAAKPSSGSSTPATGATTAAEAEEKKAAEKVIGTIAGQDLEEWQTKGLAWSPPKENTLWENGVKKLESQVMGAGSDVPDYSKRGRIVVVSSDAGLRKKIAKEIAASPLATTRDVQDFAPSAWQVKPFKLDQDATFGQTDLVMLELGPVEADGRGGALHVEHTFGDIVSFGRKIDPNFSMAGVPSSEQAGTGDGFTTFAVIGILIAAVAFLVLPAKQPEVVAAGHPEQSEGVQPWASI